MADRKPKGTKQDRVEFNPNLKYGWEKDQEFTISGEEFDIILKSLQLAADTPEFKRNVAIFQGLTVVSAIFKDGVEQGLIKEQGSSLGAQEATETSVMGSEGGMPVPQEASAF